MDATKELLYDNRKKGRFIAWIIALFTCPLGLQYLYIGGEERKECYVMLILALFVLISQGNVGNLVTQMFFIGCSVVSFLSTGASVTRRNREIKKEIYNES